MTRQICVQIDRPVLTIQLGGIAIGLEGRGEG